MISHISLCIFYVLKPKSSYDLHVMILIWLLLICLYNSIDIRNISKLVLQRYDLVSSSCYNCSLTYVCTNWYLYNVILFLRYMYLRILILYRFKQNSNNTILKQNDDLHIFNIIVIRFKHNDNIHSINITMHSNLRTKT